MQEGQLTGMSKMLTDTYCRNDLPVEELAGFCVACGGAGFITGPIDYPGFDNRRWCQHCDAGRQLNDRMADIIKRASAEDRSRSNSYNL